jgi:hypothetical protein
MENVTDLVRDLVSDMLRMLISYEVELTAYSLVLKEAQKRITATGNPWDLANNIRKMQDSLALQTEAEAEYAPFAALLQKLTPQNLEIALASIRRTIQQHDNREKW